MNKLLFLTALMVMSVLYISCDKEDDDDHDHMETVLDYHAHIHAPNADNKHVGDTMHIHVDFESHTGETVHHVKVRIYDQMDSTEIYNQPATAHVHETDGVYEFHDDLILSVGNGVTEHSDWVLEAKVWGHEAGEQEVMETVEFHVHP